ncbi:ATP-binding cassette domain-containing protein [Rhodococcus sp. IEGM 1381]|uniref:branched-chain amino acid ABC transporter ATP-binding protein/permease n=1 Tax=Rhodococcus sp. IEGM 1381 TaxID=3047085 RepID=UPI0024B843E4|nr:ATP-binding cassette domain-containing protein [Rhodococcus sp. IEGM 1381]MDI9897413.1 ATP-binding cassette domain-containing protein [Rhodococcus sp. IEGM 1381]
MTARKIKAGALIRTAIVIVYVVAVLVQAQSVVLMLSLTAIWGIATVGLGLVLGSAGQISLCQASFVLAGAYFYAGITVDGGLPPWVGLLCAIGGGGVLALVVSPVLRARGDYLALATITVALLVDRAISTGDWIPGGNSGISGVPYLELFGISFKSAESYLILSLVLLALIIIGLHLRYGRSHSRRAIHALHQDESVLAGFGGNPWMLKREVFVVGGLLGGLAGGVYAAAYGFVSSNGFGLFESFALALAVIIGGNGRLIGALFGAFIYQGSFVVLGDYSDYRFALLGVLVVLTVLFFPRGLWPSWGDFSGLVPLRGKHARKPIVMETDAAPVAVDPLALEIRGLTKRYGELTAVGDVSITLTAGSLTALIGPNGAGKTTLLDLVAAEQQPSAGSILIDGADITTVTRSGRARAGITRTYQRLRLVSSLSIIDNVLLGVDHGARGESFVSEGERRRRAERALADVGLTEGHEDDVAELTFGTRRLVEMARAIASRPRLVLLDEPSSGLNDSEAREFAEVVRGLHATGCTVVVVEHNLPFVRLLAHDIIALDRGRLLMHGPTEEVFASAEFQESYVGRGPRGRTKIEEEMS